ncbi:MAG: ATP-binding protein [Dehalococcoidia bacterium]|nr:MAG: ATP-binding protein [Dehalococcoidia bacterium]
MGGNILYSRGVENTQLVSDVQRLIENLGQLPEPVAEPVFIVVSGLPGTGKSYFCSQLAERLPVIILESDALRKTLFSSPGYSSQESLRLFRACHLLIERLLKKGVSLIFDATNLSERYREYLYSIAERLDVKLVLVRVEAPPGVVYERLKARQENSETKSDADWKVYQRMKPSVQKIRRNYYAVDTSRDTTPVIDKIVRQVSR